MMRKIQQTVERAISRSALLAFVICLGLIPVRALADPPPDANVRVINCGPKFAFYSFNSNDTAHAIAYQSACINTGQAVVLKCATSGGCLVKAHPCGKAYGVWACTTRTTATTAMMGGGGDAWTSAYIAGVARQVKATDPLEKIKSPLLHLRKDYPNQKAECAYPTPTMIYKTAPIEQDAAWKTCN